MLHTVADTHAVMWYIFADSRLSATARTTIEQMAAEENQVAFSSITLAKIVYLSEWGRINLTTLDLFLREVESDDALLVEIPCDRNIAVTLRQVDRSQIPDLRDRIIAATALYLNLPVISRDRRIQLSSRDTIW